MLEDPDGAEDQENGTDGDELVDDVIEWSDPHGPAQRRRHRGYGVRGSGHLRQPFFVLTDEDCSLK